MGQFSNITQYTLSSLCAIVLIASIAGSSHCAMMCGPLKLMLTSSWSTQALYHSGRLFIYLVFAYLSGKISKLIFGNQSYYTLSFLIAVVFALLLIFKGYQHIAPAKNTKQSSSLLLSSWIKLKNIHHGPAAFLGGILTGFLPCGWLHTFLLAMVPLRSSLHSMILIFIFWIGTLPALFGFKILSVKMFRPWQRYHPLIIGSGLLVIGLMSIGIKLSTAYYNIDPLQSQSYSQRFLESICYFHKNDKK